MVRAILAGTKTQTRRIVKRRQIGAGRDIDYRAEQLPTLACPYGKPGDRLWVRETWDFLPDSGPDEPNAAFIRYWAGGEWERRLVPDGFNPMLYSYEKKRPSIHMPRWASRITLEITDVRVERLQEISRGDAMEEGCPSPNMADGPDPREWYAALWRQINGPDSWPENPLVWVISFRRC